jgi:PhoPQ-activated pathogenicity-related protein
MSLRRPGAPTLALAALAVATTLAGTARPDVFEYVAKPDPAFAWTQWSNNDTPAGKVYHITLTSQVWRGIPWTHKLRIYEPANYQYKDHMLLFITGGSTDSQPRPEDDDQGFALANACGARIAVLPQVPNQPLLDGKKEDDLIAQTFVMYLKTQEEDLPLLFPMVKSAVAAMDAVQAWAKEKGQPVE